MLPGWLLMLSRHDLLKRPEDVYVAEGTGNCWFTKLVALWARPKAEGPHRAKQTCTHICTWNAALCCTWYEWASHVA